MLNAAYYVEKFGMLPHPEGGWYKETYRSSESLAAQYLPERFGGSRSFSTGIYFLLESGQYSAFHRIKSDEMWHFYAGGALHVFVIHTDGNGELITLGNNTAAGEVFQAVVPAGCWFASRPAKSNSFSLVGCTVAPGFDFADFEMAEKGMLLPEFPQHKQWIEQLCR